MEDGGREESEREGDGGGRERRACGGSARRVGTLWETSKAVVVVGVRRREREERETHFSIRKRENVILL